MRLHAVGSGADPFLGADGADPANSQWGMHLMRFPEAWELGTGHSTIALLDTGLETDHPDLRVGHLDDEGQFVYDGGHFRAHLSTDVLNTTLEHENCSVDELDPEDLVPASSAGHGSHVSGIVAASTGNGIGVSGACPGCSLVMAKTFPAQSTVVATIMGTVAGGLDFVMRQGAQIVSMSFGIGDEGFAFNCSDEDVKLFCTAMSLAASRDVILAASVGNDRQASFIEFPASDPRVIAVGGVEPNASSSAGYTLWDEAPTCPYGNDPRFPPNFECGSNRGPQLELVAPAKTVVSSMYKGRNHNPDAGCGDLLDGIADGYGACTGTSMSTPHVAGLAGLVRSVRPLASVDVVRDILTSTASEANNPNETFGSGVPDAVAAVERVLGQAGGQPLRQHLTPLFSLYSPVAQTHVYTIKPQAASAFLFDGENNFNPVGPTVPGYPLFPGTTCQISPCFGIARASAYVFTTDAPPFPGAPPLVPLYRLRYDPDLVKRCEDPPPPKVANHDFTYTTTASGIEAFRNQAQDAEGIGYELDAVEGYIYERCSPEPECIPAGAVRLYRLYSPARDDYAIFPETELAQMQAAGYGAQGTLESILGYVYLNVDNDGDTLIDGFESLIGTDPARADSDCDGLGDGTELLGYDASSPDPAQHGFGDPLAGPCGGLVFEDDFETGSTTRWSAVAQ